MRRSTTSVGTENSDSGFTLNARRRLLVAVLLVELALATALLWRSGSPSPSLPAAPPQVTSSPAVSAPPEPVTSMVLPDGRTALLLALGGRNLRPYWTGSAPNSVRLPPR